MVTKRKSREARRAGSKKRDAMLAARNEWTSMKIPEGVNMWKPKATSYRIDIVPFIVGKGNPCAEPGESYYERTFFLHYGIGPNNNAYVCLNKTYGKPCPICEYKAKLALDPDTTKKQLSALTAKERQLWLVYDRKDPDSGIQLWEVANWNFGALLDDRRQFAEADEPHISAFDDENAGSVLKVCFSEETGPNGSYIKAKIIDFKSRPDGLPEKLLDHGICLDDLLKEMPYDELKSIFHQEPENDDDESDDDGPEEKPAPKRKKAPLVDNDTLDNDDLPDAEPKKKKPAAKKKGKKKPASAEDDDDDEWDDDFDDEKESPLSDDDDDDWGEDDD